MANRHMIVVWDEDVSGKINNFSEAAKKIWTLLSQDSEPSTKMLAFAQDIENLNNIDSNLLKLLKKFANEIRTSNTVACSLDLPEYGWKVLFKAIVETAQKYQLIVFDEEIFLALLADGSFSPPSRNKLWQEIVEEIESGNNYPQSLIDFTANIKDRLAQMLSQNDWVLADEIIEQRYNESCLLYSKKVDFGKHQISIGCNGNYGVFKITVYLSIIDENAISICQKSGFNYSTTGILLNTPLLLLEDDDSYQITNNQSLNELLNVIQNTVIYWSNSALNIKGVDNLLNGDIDERITKKMHRHLYMPYCLIAARLANNPNFEELAINLGKYGKDSGKFWGKFNYSEVAVAWPKLVQYLRNEVKPLI